MPEGPSVLLAAHVLHERLAGATICGGSIIGGRYATHGAPAGWALLEAAAVAHSRIEGVGCKGKLLCWKIGEGVFMLSTLGLSGAWTFRKGKHSAIRIDTTHGPVWFTDQLHYGTISLVGTDTMHKRMRRLGPDVLRSPPPSAAKLRRVFDSRPEWTLPRLLMDQSKVSGIGNYLKAEVLYAAKVSPTRTTGSLTDDEFRRVYICIIIIPRMDLYKRGLQLEDVSFPWSFRMQVYGKKYDPVGNAVVRLKTDDKRTTYWAPQIQV
jgi:formamidopyrimidine-DNA glycosylase